MKQWNRVGSIETDLHNNKTWKMTQIALQCSYYELLNKWCWYTWLFTWKTLVRTLLYSKHNLKVESKLYNLKENIGNHPNDLGI